MHTNEVGNGRTSKWTWILKLIVFHQNFEKLMNLFHFTGIQLIPHCFRYTPVYCIHGYFCGGFIFVNFVSQSSQKFLLHYMAIYSIK